MPVEYVTVYKISKGYPDWLFTCGEFLPLLAAALIILAKWRLRWQKLTWPQCIFIGFLALVSAIVVPSSDIDSLAFDTYHSGIYSIVEGTVSDFHPMPYEGHSEECFTVQTQRFCYSDYLIVPGFHNTASHGGPIRDGLPVRIAYSGSTILRLDVAANRVPSPGSSAAATSLAKNEAEARLQSDPTSQQFVTAALITAACFTLWWNLQWKRIMRFWVRPPNRPVTQLVFRIFFAANFVGALIQLARQLCLHPFNSATVGPILFTTAIMCTVTGIVSLLVLWRAEQRDQKRASTDVPLPPHAS